MLNLLQVPRNAFLTAIIQLSEKVVDSPFNVLSDLTPYNEELVHDEVVIKTFCNTHQVYYFLGLSIP